MAFPHLFPYGLGDPFGISEGHSTVTANLKFKHLVSYCYKRDGRLVFPFQEDQRFLLWLYNLKYRHMMTEQCKVFVKSQPQHLNKTVTEWIESIALGNQNPVLQDLTRYFANIPGTPCYWKDACADLKAIIGSKKAPTVFGSFTFADNYDSYLHKLLGIPEGANTEFIKRCLLVNAAIVENYFIKKFTIFREEVLVKLYCCTPEQGAWYWGRAKWQHRRRCKGHCR